MIHLLNVAKACMPATRRSSSPPSVSQWLFRVQDSMLMEDFTVLLKGNQDFFMKTWLLWLQFRETQGYASLLHEAL